MKCLRIVNVEKKLGYLAEGEDVIGNTLYELFSGTFNESVSIGHSCLKEEVWWVFLGKDHWTEEKKKGHKFSNQFEAQSFLWKNLKS